MKKPTIGRVLIAILTVLAAGVALLSIEIRVEKTTQINCSGNCQINNPK